VFGAFCWAVEKKGVSPWRVSGAPTGSSSGTYTAENPANRLGFLLHGRKAVSKEGGLRRPDKELKIKRLSADRL